MKKKQNLLQQNLFILIIFRLQSRCNLKQIENKIFIMLQKTKVEQY